MNTAVSYTQFKQAFLDQATMKGYDADFLEGFFKRAEEEYSNWEALVNSAYKGNTELCKQAYAEMAHSLQYTLPEKRGEGEFGPELLGMLDQFGSGIGSLFGQQGGSGLGGALAGGGGGMLLGLLLSQMFDIPLPIALTLGALGGGALGYGAAGTQAGQKHVFGVNAGGTTKDPNPPPTPTMGPSAGAEAPPAGGNPTAAAAVANGQATANAAATPGQTPPVAPPAAAAPKPATPPPAQPQVPAPTPSSSPVVPPGGQPAAGQQPFKPLGQK